MKQESYGEKIAYHTINSYPTRSLRQYLAYKSVQNTEQAENLFRPIEIDYIQSSPEPKIQIEIDLGDGQGKIISVDSHTNIEFQAEMICQSYNLDSYVKDLLVQSIRQKYRQQKQQIYFDSLRKQQESLRELSSQNHVRQIILSQGEQSSGRYHNEMSLKEGSIRTCESRGASKILDKYHHKVKRHSFVDNYVENKENQPEINKVSQQICNKLGKQNIISHKNKRSRQKIQAIIKQKQERQNELMKECQFRPKINAISKIVDEQIYSHQYLQDRKLDRYERLYENYKTLELKKRQEKLLLQTQISFKPNINQISKKIVQNRRQTSILQYERSSKNLHRNCSHQHIQSLPQIGRKPVSRNTENLPIGDYLYNQAMKKSKPKVAQSKMQIKALEHSDYLMTILKEKRFNQIFTELTQSPHQQLNCLDINLSLKIFKYGIYRYFLPIFNQMIQMDVSITRQQFVQASLRLFKTMSPDQKHEVIFKKTKKPQSDLSVAENHSLVNSKSREILKKNDYDRVDIYQRGLEHKRNIVQKIERNREDKVRQQLRECSFKPFVKQMI